MVLSRPWGLRLSFELRWCWGRFFAYGSFREQHRSARVPFDPECCRHRDCLEADRRKYKRIAFPVSDRVSAVCSPWLVEMLAAIGVDAHHVGPVFGKNPELVRPDHELVRIGQ